jgi:tetratricopeptide (TPR) repeat protein
MTHMRPVRTTSVLVPFLAIFVLAFAWPIVIQGASRETFSALFTQANSLYQNGDFGSAERLYRQLIEKGAEGGALYYNLGNACFKQRKLGEAVYFWEKAARRLPGDPDIKENLDLAALLVVDRIEVPADPLPLRSLDSMVHRLTINQDCWTVLLLFVIANIAFAIYIRARSRRLATYALTLVVMSGMFVVIFGCSLGWKLYEKNSRLEGVIVEQRADVRSGPGSENITVFTVHEGIQVRVRGESSGWYQVSLPNGWSGWLPKNAIMVLD